MFTEGFYIWADNTWWQCIDTILWVKFCLYMYMYDMLYAHLPYAHFKELCISMHTGNHEFKHYQYPYMMYL